MMDPTNEVGHKMRSAIKAKLNELGCYVDDELPDYVMVMVANKRSRTQMEDDLQLFLGSNTEIFVDWLHQVLQKLQEVKIPPIGALTPLAITATTSKRVSESEVPVKKEKKDKKHKEKKSKRDESSSKSSAKSSEKRNDCHLELNNADIEMVEPCTNSITDVFANKILQNVKKNTQSLESKNKIEETEITSTSEPRRKLLNRDKILSKVEVDTGASSDTFDIPTISEIELQLPKKIIKRGRREVSELNEIEKKIAVAKKELANLNPEDSDDDVININENDELIDIDEQRNLFAKSNLETDINNKISLTPPPKKSLSERLGERPVEKNVATLQNRVVKTVETNLERLTIRSRLGNRNIKSSPVLKREAIQSLANRISSQIIAVPPRRSESPEELEPFAVSSVIKVKPRPLIPANQQANKNLLLKAVADAQKSIAAAVVRPDRSRPAELFTKKYRDNNREMKIGVTLPIRRANMRITVNSSNVRDFNNENTDNANEYVPEPVVTTDSSEAEEYIPSSIETSVNKAKESDTEDQFEITKIANDLISQNGDTKSHSEAPQFVVTLHGLDSSMFPSRKRKMDSPARHETSPAKETREERISTDSIMDPIDEDKPPVVKRKHTPIVYDKMEEDNDKKKINVNEVSSSKSSDTGKSKVEQRSKEETQNNNEVECVKPPEKIVKLKEVHKYDNLPATLSSEISKPKIRERCRFFPSCRLGDACEFSHPSSKLILCKAFPNCKFGTSCLYLHPQCKYDPDCTKRDCPFSHSATTVAAASMVVASHVVPVQSYKTISNAPLPTMCRFYPQCSNPQCTFYHPKLCRFGKYCHNKVECNFYHHELPSKDKLTWKPSNFQPI